MAYERQALQPLPSLPYDRCVERKYLIGGFLFSILMMFSAVLLLMLGYICPIPKIHPLGAALIASSERWFGMTHYHIPLSRGVLVNLNPNLKEVNENIYEMYGYLINIEEKKIDGTIMYSVTFQNAGSTYSVTTNKNSVSTYSGIGKDKLIEKGSLIYIQWRSSEKEENMVSGMIVKKPTTKLLETRPHFLVPLYQWANEPEL